MKNLTAQQKLRVQKEFEHFKNTHGALPTKLTDFKAGLFSKAERQHASWLIKRLREESKKKNNPHHLKNNPHHLKAIDLEICKLKIMIERETQHLKKLEVEGRWRDTHEVRNRIFDLMKRQRWLERERYIQDDIFNYPEWYEDESEEDTEVEEDERRKRKNPNYDEREKSIIMTEAISFINHNFCSFLQDFYKTSYEDNIGYLFSNLDVVVGSSYNPQGITSEDQQEYGNLEKYYPEFYKEGVEQRKKYFIAMRNVVMYYKDMMKNVLRVRRGYGFTPYRATKKFDIKDVIKFHNNIMSGVREFADDLIMGKWET